MINNMNKRIKQQETGNIQPYTVMLETPVVVNAASVEEAVRIAKRRQQPAVNAEEEGDGSTIR